jgi:hypothetical protein
MLSQTPFFIRWVLNIKNSLFFKFRTKKRIKKEVTRKIEIIKERIRDYNEIKFLLKKTDEEIILIVSGWYLEVIILKRKYKLDKFLVEKLVKD